MFSRLLRNVRGTSSAQYALLLGLVGGAIVLAALALGGAIGTGLDKSSAVIASNGGAATPPAAPGAGTGSSDGGTGGTGSGGSGSSGGTGGTGGADNPNAHGNNPNANPKAGPDNPGQAKGNK